MFEISWSELLILAVVTLLFVGPKELPVFLRTIGRYAGMMRRQAAEFKSHFDTAMREAELSHMKEEMEKMQASVNAEVMGAERAFKDASAASTIVAPTAASQPASFTAVAQAAVFPASAPAAALGQVYAKPKPEPESATPSAEQPAMSDAAGTAPAAPAEAPAQTSPDTAPEPEPPRPQVVTSEPIKAEH
jgi:sec-independent protein translocase protein TatB